MRTRIATKVLLAAVAVIGLASGAFAQKKAGMITRQIQPAQVERAPSAAAARPAAAGGIPKPTLVKAVDKTPIFWDDVLVTGQGGRMRASLDDGSILNVGPASKLTVKRMDTRTQQSQFELNYGKVRAQVVKLSRPDSKFEIRTNTAICGVLGTDEYIDASSPTSTLVMNLSDPNSRSRVHVKNSDPAVAGTVELNPGEATRVDAGKPPTGARPTTNTEVNQAQQDTAASTDPIPTPTLQVTSGTVTPGATPSVRIEAGAQITLDARLSTSGGGAFTGFLWQVPKRNFQSTEPYLVLETKDWPPGSYDATLSVTTTQNKTAQARFTIVVTQSIAGRAAPEDAIQALARAYETLQVSQFLACFHQNYPGYASLEQTINQSFANIAENRVYVRKANGTIQGNAAIYQVDFEIRFLPKTTALPQAGVAGYTATAAAPPMYRPARSNGIRPAAATASISGNTGAVATFVQLTSVTTGFKLFVNTGTGSTYTFKDLPPDKYQILPQRTGFSFDPASRTVDLTEAGLTGVDFTAIAEAQVVHETVTVQMEYVPNASWHITNLSGPIGSAGMVGIPNTNCTNCTNFTPPPDQPANVAVADFTVSAAPDNLGMIAIGGSGATITITLSPVSGFSGNVNLNWILPAGLSINPGGTQALNITSGAVSRSFVVTAGPGAALGNNTIAFTLQSGSITKQGSNSVGVYTLTAALAAATTIHLFAGGSSATLPITVSTSPGLTTPVTVTAAGAGITASTATVNGNGTANLTLSTSAPDVGATTVQVTLTAAGLPPVNLSVPISRDAPFTLGSGGPVSFLVGGQGSASVTVNFAAGFSGSVTVTPPGISGVSFTPPSIALASTAAAVFGVTATAPFTGSGAFTAAAGSFTASTSISLDISRPAVEFELTAGALGIMAGQTGAVSVNARQTQGATVPISLSVMATSGSITVTGGGTVTGNGTVTFVVTVPQGTPAGTASFTVTASGGGVTHTVPVPVTITAQPPVIFSVSGGSITLAAGGTGPVTIQVSQTSGPTATIGVTASGYDTSRISVSGGGPVTGSGSVTLTISALRTAAPGSTAFTVTATGGGVTQSATVTVTITPSVTFAISGGSTTVTAGGTAATVNVQVTQTLGDPAPIVVAAGAPSGNITVSGGGTVTGGGPVPFTVSAPSSAGAGTASFTVTATYGGVSQSATVTVTIQAQPNFTISGGSLNLIPGGAPGTVPISVTQIAGSPVDIAVSAKDVDGSKISVAGGGPVTGGGTVNFTVTALPGAAGGVTTFTVTATWGSVSHSATVNVTIGTFTLGGPAAVSIVEGTSGTVALTVTPATFSGTIALASTGSTGLAITGPTTLAASGGSYTVNAAVGAADGTVKFTATSGALTSSVTVTVTVLPGVDAITATGGSSFATGTLTIPVSVTRAGGFTGPVTVEVAAQPSGITVSPTIASVTGSTTNFTATVASGTTSGGAVGFTARATGSDRTKTASATIDIVPPFTLSGGASFSVTAGATAGSTTASVAFAQGFTGPVNVTAAADAGSVQVSGGSLTGSGPVNINVMVPGTATAGNHTLTVTASGAGITQTATISFAVLPPAPPPVVAGSIAIVSGNNQSAVIGNPLASPLVVVVNSTMGAAMPGVTVNFAVSPTGAATLSAASATTASNGQAQVTVQLGSIVGSLTVTASVSGLSSTASFNLTAVGGVAAWLSYISGSAQWGRVGGTGLDYPLVVKVYDAHERPVAGLVVNFVVAPTGAATLSAASATSDASGQAQVRVTALGTVAQTFTVTASVQGVTGTVVFNLTAVAGAPESLKAAPNMPQSGTVNQQLSGPLVVTLADSYGNPVANGAVTFAVAPAGAATLVTGASQTTDTSGQAKVTVALGTLAQALTITASYPSLSPVVFNLTAVAGPPTTLTIVGNGNNQAAMVGQTLPYPLVVLLADAYSNPVANVVVSFLITGDGATHPYGTLNPLANSPNYATLINTGVDGKAQVTWTLGTTAGVRSLTVSVPSVPTITPVTFNETAAPVAGTIAAGSGQAPPGAFASVPISVSFPGLSVDGISFSVMVTPSGTAPAFSGTGNFAFIPSAGIPSPTLTDTGARSDTVSLSFLNLSTPLTGSVILGQLRIKVPVTATSGQTYIIHIQGGSLNSGSTTSIPAQSGADGTLTVNAAAPPTGGGMVSATYSGSPSGGVASVPITLTLSSGTSLETLSFSLTIIPVTPAPPLSANLSFSKAATLPTPTPVDGTMTYISVAWLTAISPALSGTVSLGNVSVPIPSTAAASQTYTLRITGASGTLGTSTINLTPGPDATITLATTGGLSFAKKASLEIPAEELRYAPASPREGDTVRFQVRVRNSGSADARGAELSLLLAGRVLASERVDVAAGKTAAVELAWKAEATNGRELRLALRAPGQAANDLSAVTLRLRNFAVERPAGLASLRRERITVEVPNEGCAALRLLTGASARCGGTADLEFQAAITPNGRVSLQARAAEGGLADLGVQPLSSITAAPASGYLPQATLEAGRIYALKTRNRYAIVRVVRIASSVNPRLLADERQRQERGRFGRGVVDTNPLDDMRDSRTLDKALDAARISVQLELLLQEDGSPNFR